MTAWEAFVVGMIPWLAIVGMILLIGLIFWIDEQGGEK